MRDQDELREKLKGQYEEIVGRVLGKQRSAGEISLEEIEEAALEIGRAVQGAVTRELVEQSEQQERDKRPCCPSCQGSMRQKGYRLKQIITRSGEVEVQRKYWYCEHCKAGIFPPR